MDRASIRPGQERATCTLSDTPFAAYEEVSPEAGEAATRLLFQILEGDPRFAPVPEGRCLGLLNAMLAADVKASQLRLIQSFGEELGVGGVMYGKLFRYDERVGSAYSVKRPASVAFTLHLIRVADGAILWKAAFDETQQPLSENLFKLQIYRKSGMRWLTADELVRLGLTKAIDKLKQRLP